MRIPVALLLMGILVSGEGNAARCKIDGKWYDYDSPQCNPSRTDEPTAAPSESSPQPIPPGSETTRSLPGSPGQPSQLQDWEAVAPAALERCRKMPNPGMANSCRLKEEMGYWAMRGNFDMPPGEAGRAKALCRSRTASFEGQATCMESESRGYSTFHSDLGLPIAYGDKARAECMRQEAWSVRARCMLKAENLYEKGPKSRSVRPPNAAIQSRAFAGERQPPAGYPRQTGPETFTVNPELKETHNTVFQPSVPQPMHISQRAFLMGIRSEDYSTIEAFTDAVEARSSTVLLSPARPFIEDVGFLSFHSALSVHPGRDSAILRSEDEAKAYLILNVSKGRNYLVEFVVKSFQDSVYRLAAESDEREIEDPGGALNHVIAIVTAEGTGVAHVSLSQSVGHSFELFGVQVTSFEP